MTLMANLTLDLNINSASNLTNVNLLTKMDVYAVITLHGDDIRKKQKVKTSVDRCGGSNPTWNHSVKFSMNERLGRDGRLTLVIRLISRRVFGNKDIGGVKVPLLELMNSFTPSINSVGNSNGMKFVTYLVKSPSGKRKGSLNFSYRFNTPTIGNWSSAVTLNFPSTVYPPPSKLNYLSALPQSKIEHSPLAPPELANPITLTKNSDHQKDSVVERSSSGALPISYGPALINQLYFCSTRYDKPGHDYHHAPPSQSSYTYVGPPSPSHQGYGQYDYAPPSPAGYGYGCPSSQLSKGIGLGVGLLGGLMVGDIMSDVANYFDL